MHDARGGAPPAAGAGARRRRVDDLLQYSMVAALALCEELAALRATAERQDAELLALRAAAAEAPALRAAAAELAELRALLPLPALLGLATASSPRSSAPRKTASRGRWTPLWRFAARRGRRSSCGTR